MFPLSLLGIEKPLQILRCITYIYSFRLSSVYLVENFTSIFESSQIPTKTDTTLPKMTNGLRRLAMKE